ncbi:hypothetical protein [Actinomadura sp. B10D3]|uniref:hypothetical protein n=1 Tax=Actinomadura sp. B10D3 TaxID=3153557 RepID=UPI00325F366E
MTDDEIDLRDYVAVCPVTEGQVRQIIGLADMSWDDPEATDAAMLSLGWSEPDDTVQLSEVQRVTDQGQFVFGEDGFFMPFAYFYTVGGEASPDDPFASFPGWSLRRDVARGDFEAVINNAVELFTASIGLPDHTVALRGSSSMTLGPITWRHAAWRRDKNVLIVGPKSDAMSYHQFEEGAVHIIPLAVDAPFPEGDELSRLLYNW